MLQCSRAVLKWGFILLTRTIHLKECCIISMPRHGLLKKIANFLFSYNPLFFTIPLHYPLSLSIKPWAAGSRKGMKMDRSLCLVTVKCTFLAMFSWPRKCETQKKIEPNQTACVTIWYNNVWYTKQFGSKEKIMLLLDSIVVLTSISLCFNWQLIHIPTFFPLF